MNGIGKPTAEKGVKESPTTLDMLLSKLNVSKASVMRSQWRLYAVSTGITMVIAPQYALTNLQTSIGVKDALGSMGMLVYEVLCVATLLIYVPMFALLGRKTSLVLSLIPSVLFTLSMMYPRFWTVTPAEILLGIAESVLMTAVGAIVSSVIEGDQATNERKQSNIGVYLAILACGQAISCLTADFVLKDSGKQRWSGNASSLDDKLTNVSNCGANDCPMDYSFKQNSRAFGNLIPTQYSMLIYMGALCVTQIFGIIALWLSVPGDNVNTTETEDKQHLLPKAPEGAFAKLKKAFRRLLAHMSTKHCLLTIPLQMQYGMFCGFLWSEVGRSYVSCTIGISHMGFFLFITYIVTLISTSILHCLRSSIPHPAIFMVSFVIEFSLYMLSLLWQPTTDSLYMLNVMAVVTGAANAFRRFTSYFIASVYSDDLDSSYAVRTGFVALGVAIVNTWATVMCVNIKIYIIASWLIVSTVLAMVGHCLYNRSISE